MVNCWGICLEQAELGGNGLELGQAIAVSVQGLALPTNCTWSRIAEAGFREDTWGRLPLSSFGTSSLPSWPTWLLNK